MFKSQRKNENLFVEDPNKPIFLSIESYFGMSKKQLEKYVYGLAEKNVQSLRGSNYQIVKFEKGYVVELQDGGNGYGVLQSVLRHLEDHNEAIVETSSNRKVKIVKKTNNNGTFFKSYSLNEDDNTPATESITYIDQLNPIITPGYGFWRLSIGIAVIGVLTLFSGAIFKNIVYNTDEQLSFNSTGKKVPLEQLNEILIAKPHEGNYISALKYKKSATGGNGWSREEKELPKPKVDPTPVEVPVKTVESTELDKLNEVINSNEVKGK